MRMRLVGLLVAGVAAGCTGNVGDQTTGGAGSNGGPGAAGSNGGPGVAGNNGTPGTAGSPVVTGTAGNTGAAGGPEVPSCTGTCVCAPGIPGTSQVARMTRLQYDTVVKDLLGVTTLASAGNMAPSSLLSEDSTGPLTDISWNGYLSVAEKVATAVMASSTSKAKFITCADATQATCLTSTIKTFGRKAFRRPLTDAEVTSLSRFNSLTPKGTSDQVAESVLFAILASPSFIALPELGQTTEGTALKLTSYEVATRLSFLLWNSVPDDTLNTEADADRLTTSAADQDAGAADAPEPQGRERSRPPSTGRTRTSRSVRPGRTTPSTRLATTPPRPTPRRWPSWMRSSRTWS